MFVFHNFVFLFFSVMAIFKNSSLRNLVKNRNDGREPWRRRWSLDGIKHSSTLTCAVPSFVHVSSRSPCGTAIDSTPDALSEKYFANCHQQINLSTDCQCIPYFFLQVVIDLGVAPLDGEADWYSLTSHEESLQILVSLAGIFVRWLVRHRTR